MRREGKPDQVPFEISWGAFTPRLMEVYREKTGSTLDVDEYFDFDIRSVNLCPTKKTTDFAKYFDEVADNATFDEWGVGAIPGSEEHFLEYTYHPLAKCETAQDVYDYEWPDVDADYRFEGMAQKVKAYQDRGYAVVGELYQTIFETAWLLRGMEELLVDFYVNQEVAHAICEKLAQLRVRQAEMYAAAGVDIIRLGDDVATQRGPMMSQATYETFLKDRTKRIVDAGKAINPDVLYFIHNDGKVEDFAQNLVDIGIDILNPCQPECNDLELLFERYGDKIAFWGGIGTQSTMPFGSPEDVRAKVRYVQETLGRNGSLLIAPSHILEPEVPWENVEAFIDAVKRARYQ